MLLLGVPSHIGEGQDDDREARRRGFFGRGGRRGLRLNGFADFERIDADRLGDVLEPRRTKIRDGEFEPRFHLAIGVLGKADCAGLGDPLQPRRDIDAVAHQIAIALLDDIAEVNADAKIDGLVLWQARVAIGHAGLDFDGAAHGVDHAAEFDDEPVAGALDHPPVMHGDGRIDQIAAQRPQPRERAILVRPSEPRVADHIRNQDRRNFPGLAHRASPPCGLTITKARWKRKISILTAAAQPRWNGKPPSSRSGDLKLGTSYADGARRPWAGATFPTDAYCRPSARYPKIALLTSSGEVKSTRGWRNGTH